MSYERHTEEELSHVVSIFLVGVSSLCAVIYRDVCLMIDGCLAAVVWAGNLPDFFACLFSLFFEMEEIGRNEVNFTSIRREN